MKKTNLSTTRDKKVHVTLIPSNHVYSTSYDKSISVGELIRNCCVNLGIDPDTENGITKNITVYYECNGIKSINGNDTNTSRSQFIYNPYESFQYTLEKLGTTQLNLFIERNY